MRHLLMIFCLAIGLNGQAQTRENLTFDGKNRSMIVYVPNDLPANRPLVITLHGFNQSAQYQMEHTKWNVVADTAKFVVVYPDYEGGWWDVNGTKDTRFIEHIMTLMHTKYDVDLNRVYISGFSLGAMMTYQCIEKLGNKVAAFAPVSGVRFDNRAPVAPRNVPIIHTHCKGDDVFKWGGDLAHAAGGYPSITEYVKNWAVYEGMNPTPEVIDPYPASKTGSDADMTIYRRDDSVVEVRLLSFDGAGHWHVDADAWGGVSTTSEIWNFCKRYTLNLKDVEPPVLQTVEPENASFDLPQTQRTISLSFDRPANLKAATARLAGNGLDIVMQADGADDAEQTASQTLSFQIPAEVEIPDGDYKLIVSGVRTEQGEFTRDYTLEYSYGVQPTGDAMNVETIFWQDWNAMYASAGEALPEGWQQTGGSAKLKSVGAYGDITTGLCLSAQESDNCNVCYGRTTDKYLNLPVGRYVLSFNSAYGDKVSQRGKATFSVMLQSKSNRGGLKTVVKDSDLASKNEVSSWPVFDTMRHEYTFDVEKKDNYVLNFDINQGKKMVCIANVLITTAPSNADRYKGEFLRLYRQAQEIYTSEALPLLEQNASEEIIAQITTFKAVIDKYNGLVSTMPSVYTAAINEIREVMTPFIPLPTGIGTTNVGSAKVVSVQYFTTDGRKVTKTTGGIVLQRQVYDNGMVDVRKVVR